MSSELICISDSDSICLAVSESEASLPSCAESVHMDQAITIFSDSEDAVSLPSMVNENEDDFEDDNAAAVSQDDTMESRNEVFAEIFSRPRVIATIAALNLIRLLSGSLSVDILTGFDLRKKTVRENVMQSLLLRGIKIVVLSPPCTMFSQIMRINFAKMKASDLKQRWKDAMCFIRFTVQVIEYILSISGIFVFEHPTGASSWKLPCIQRLIERPGVRL